MKRHMRILSAAAGLLTLGAMCLPVLSAPALAQAQTQPNLTPQQKAAIEAARKKKQQQMQQQGGAGAQGQKPAGKPPGKPLVKQVQPKAGPKPPQRAVVKPGPKPPVNRQIGQPKPGFNKPPINQQAVQPKVAPQGGQQAQDPNKRFRRPLVRRPNPNQPPIARPNVPGKRIGLPPSDPGNLGLPSAAKVYAPPQNRGPANLQALKGQRRQIVAKRGNAVVIKEPDNRTIIKRNNRSMIVHNESNRLARGKNVRQEKRGKNNVTVIQRPGNVNIYNITDNSGQLVRRYRRDADGREHNIIDNRRHRGDKSRWRRNLAIGLGIGAGVVAGAAILNAMVDVPPARVDLPREKYIVDYDDADEEDVYEAFAAPPVDVVERRYTLDEVRATPRLRERMRRVDLNDITFELGSWEVDESQFPKLERVARALKRVVDGNPNEVFMIEGYTDAVGDEDDNLTLSDRRAEAVAVILSEQFEVPAENLTTQGYGEQYQKVETDGPERANRRVAVRRITPLLSQGEQQSEPEEEPRSDADDEPRD